MNKILVDTNILVYSIDKDSEKYEISSNILKNSQNQLIVTSKNITEFISVITKKTFPVTFTISEAFIFVERFHKFLEIIFPDENSFRIFKDISQKYNPYGLKVHDFEIAVIAIANDVFKIITFNIKDFNEIEEIDVIDASKFHIKSL